MIDLDFLFFIKNMPNFYKIGQDEEAEPFCLPTDKLIQQIRKETDYGEIWKKGAEDK